jgi:hypothetical protein
MSFWEKAGAIFTSLTTSVIGMVSSVSAVQEVFGKSNSNKIADTAATAAKAAVEEAVKEAVKQIADAQNGGNAIEGVIEGAKDAV